MLAAKEDARRHETRLPLMTEEELAQCAGALVPLLGAAISWAAWKSRASAPTTK